jgi:UDP-N-acetylglucosamine 2-epimerase (non-hydrolysing)
MKTAIVLGTRPEIIKFAPIIKNLKKSERLVVFSGQHYDIELGLQFFEELGLPEPDFKLRIGKNEPAVQIGEIMCKLQMCLGKIKLQTVLVQGDTNSALAGAIWSLKNKIPISHVEAGLRSFDWRMPEEHNRILIDHISEFLFAATNNSKNILKSEKVHGKIHVTGNTIIDAIEMYSKQAAKSLLDVDQEYVLFTTHRAENVDNPKIISEILAAIIESNEKIIFPIHPRTLNRLKEFQLLEKIEKNKNIRIMKSTKYFDMIKLMKNSKFIITDSGGIQEESTSPSIRKKTIVIRKTTDRPEAIKAGYSILAGTKKSKILASIKEISKDPNVSTKKNPYGKGDASYKILSILRQNFN